MNTELIDLQIEERTPLDMDFALNEAYYEEHKQLAQKFGMQGQIELADEYLKQVRRPKISSSCLPDEELLIWREFLPTSYRGTILRPIRSSRNLTSYRFDLIPKHIYQQWVEWDNSGAFDEFEIRTEERLMDPALFGIRDGKYWLLARWGATGEELISFQDIEERLWKRVERTRVWCMAVLMVFTLAIALLLANILESIRLSPHQMVVFRFWILYGLLGATIAAGQSLSDKLRKVLLSRRSRREVVPSC